MIKDVLQKFNEQYLSELVAFWRMYINALEMKNPQDVLPELQAALTGKQAFLGSLESVGC